tara:strand:- start:23 stop:322 length:300 start_codon:yes stop_codon:yes gene_type:complete
MTKLLRDEISLVEAVDVMSRRIEVLERDKHELQDLLTKQFDRGKRKERDHRRLNWLEGHPAMIDYFEGYWFYAESDKREISIRGAIDAAMKASNTKSDT